MIPDFVIRYTVTLFSASVTLAVGVMLLMLSVPQAEEWKKFRTVRLCLAFTCLVLSASDFATCFALDGRSDPKIFSTLTLIVASFQALLFTTASLVFVRSAHITRRSVLTHIGIITAGGAFLVGTQLFAPPPLFPFVFAAAIAAYLAQILLYTLAFRKDYSSCVEQLEAFYDEEEKGRMRWISHCFYSALAVGVVALFFCVVPYSSRGYDMFVLTYTVYYVYIAGCVVNYRIKAGFIVGALKEVQPEPETDGEAARPVSTDWEEELRVALEKWVAEKRFVYMDSTPDMVAKELGTTKSLMNSWFARFEQLTFREWRTRLRIKEAERLLRECDDVTVSCVHELVGVSDKSNFRKHFRQLVGMTPNEYREQFRQHP